MKKSTSVLILLGGLALAFLAIALLGNNSRSQRALREYKAKLRAQGEKLTYKELTQTRSTNQHFSLGTFTNATQRLRSAPFDLYLLECRKFVGPGRARVLSWESEPISSRQGPTNSPKTWQQLAIQTENNKAALEDIREELKEPASWLLPGESIIGRPVMPFVAIRNVAQALNGAFVIELHLGHRLEALKNLQALSGLSQLNREEYTLVSQMIRIAIGRLGLGATWEALQAADLTEPELQQLQTGWEAVDFLDALERGFSGERAVGDELWRLLRKPGGSKSLRALVSRGTGPSQLSFDDLLSDYVLTPAYKMTSANEDELFHLRLMQQSLEAIRSVKVHRPWSEAKANLDKTLAEVSQVDGSPQRFRYQFSLIAIPNVLNAANTVVRAETERQLTITAIALRRFQLRNGKPPPRLEALVPEFLESAPIDCMSGKVLGYWAREDGSFVLYSVGENGSDDGGNATPKSGGSFDLWNSPDAVWPTPANRDSVTSE